VGEKHEGSNFVFDVAGGGEERRVVDSVKKII